ncbi:hypothetical protein CL615_01350 [archaeon]|jgi:hypothetical protein|nr:hypothetical protein [archaeon]|tara:strand:- start:685 stop:2466 length:1782 start_codon:yes stop_codon:yes gene_type:complete
MKYKKSHKKSNIYIKNPDKCYSPETIRKTNMLNSNKHVPMDILAKENRLKNILLKSIPLVLVLIAVSSIIFFIKPATTGYSVITEESNFTDNIGLIVNENSDYTWNLENEGLLKSVKLNGEVKNSGTVKIYLEHENNTYLIFDNKKLKESDLEGITGFVVIVDEIEVEITGNLTADEEAIINSIITNINETKDDVEIEIETEDNETKTEVTGNLTAEQTALIDSLTAILDVRDDEEIIKIKIKSEFLEIEVPDEEEEESDDEESNEEIDDNLINDTINTTEPLNETVVNETIEDISVNKINIALGYKQDSIYDANDDGRENIDGVIDLTVENTEFDWQVDEKNLCTRWDTFSVENEENILACYGSSRCCSFVDLSSVRPDWNEPLYSTYGQYGAGLNNIISAQVLYVDYNLSLQVPYSEIYYSEWKNLSAEFYKDFVRFEDACLESCILPNLNSSSYKLIFEIDNSSLILDSITYRVLIDKKINNPPLLRKNFSDISFSRDKKHEINLNDYFYDLENDNLTFNYYKNSSINVSLENEIAVLTSDNDFTGTTYMFFTANDSVNTIASDVFKVEVKVPIKLVKGMKSLRDLIDLG